MFFKAKVFKPRRTRRESGKLRHFKATLNVAIVGVLFLMNGTAQATSYNFTGAVPGEFKDWNDAGNWSPIGVPGAGDSATISPAFSSGYAARLTTSVTVANLNIVSGAVTGGQTINGQTINLTVTGNLNLSAIDSTTGAGGIYGGSQINLPSGSQLNVSAGAQLNATINNSGTATITTAEFQTRLDEFNNLSGGVVNLGGSGALLMYGSIHNAGTVNKTGSGTVTVGNSNFGLNNNGIVNVQGGTLELASGISLGTFNVPSGKTLKFGSTGAGTHELQAGSTIAGAGDVIVNGNVTLNGNYNLTGNTTVASDGSIRIDTDITLPTLTVNDGTIYDNGVGSLTVTGTFTQVGGITQTIINLPTGSQASISDGANLGARTINNSGTFTVTNSANSNQLGTFNNLAGGVLSLEGSETATLHVSSLNNAGTINKVGSGTLSLNSGFLFNTGLLDVQAGTLNLAYGCSQTAGSTKLSGGNLAVSNTGSQIDISGGVLTGAGTIAGAVSISNGGTLTPGSDTTSAATINSGSYTQTGAFNVQIGGANAATADYDQLNVTGAVNLGGTLAMSLINSYVPTFGAAFTIISNDGTDAVTGTFTDLPQGAFVYANGYAFEINYAGGDGNDVTLTATYRISISDVTLTEGNSGNTNATFTVSLSSAAIQTITVDYATADGTGNAATAGSDYTPTSGTLTFAPGALTQTVSVPILSDAIDENNERFVVNLSNPINATIADAQGLGTINDNDPTPSLTISNASITEGSVTANASFTVTLSAVSGRTVTVNYTTADGTAKQPGDYTSRSGTLTFTPGQTTKNLTVAVRGDNVDEIVENFKINLSGAVAANIADNQGVCTITDDDTSAITINDVSLVESDAGPKNMKFTVTLSNPNSRTVSVDYATANNTALAGSDYVAKTGTVIFSIGETVRTFIVESTGDLLDENNESYFVNLSNATNATITDTQGIGTINDDDLAPSLSIGDITVDEGDSGTTAAIFTVSLSEISGRDVSVTLTTANGTAKSGEDYNYVVGAVTIPAGQLSQTFTVTVLGDTDIEDDETFKINLSAAIGANIADNQAVCTITNDDVSQ